MPLRLGVMSSSLHYIWLDVQDCNISGTFSENFGDGLETKATLK